jgi:hypothetical protein
MDKSRDIWETFDQLQDFPFPATAFSELKRYVKSVHELLPHISDQQAVRLKAQLAIATDPVVVGELESELERIRVDGSALLPRLVWGGVLVSTYAAFEYGVEQVLRHWQTTARHRIGFAQGREDFLTAAERYTEH